MTSLNKFTVRRHRGLMPWMVTTPDGRWYTSPTYSHAIETIDHLIGHHHAHRRAVRKES